MHDGLFTQDLWLPFDYAICHSITWKMPLVDIKIDGGFHHPKCSFQTIFTNETPPNHSPLHFLAPLEKMYSSNSRESCGVDCTCWRYRFLILNGYHDDLITNADSCWEERHWDDYWSLKRTDGLVLFGTCKTSNVLHLALQCLMPNRTSNQSTRPSLSSSSHAVDCCLWTASHLERSRLHWPEPIEHLPAICPEDQAIQTSRLVITNQSVIGTEDLTHWRVFKDV